MHKAALRQVLVLTPLFALGCAQTPAATGAAPAAGTERAVSAQLAGAFTLCAPQCGGAEHYVGYMQNNAAQMNSARNTAPPSGAKVFPDEAEIAAFSTAPRRTEARVELEDGNFVLSSTRIEALRVGFARKTESIIAQATTGQGRADSLIRLVWGDTLRIGSDSLPKGTAVTLTITRVMGGFATPLNDFAFYDVRSQTLIDGAQSGPLNYSIKRDPGVGQTDQIVGAGDTAQTLQVKVGQVIKLEGLLSAVDGAVSSAGSQQFLNGGDSSAYTVTVSAGACIKSSSGKLSSGVCR